METSLDVLATLITYGVVSIDFEYEIVSRLEKVEREQPPHGGQRPAKMQPPIDNLNQIVLYDNITSFLISFC